MSEALNDLMRLLTGLGDSSNEDLVRIAINNVRAMKQREKEREHKLISDIEDLIRAYRDGE